MVRVDARMGEGGGQVVRLALTLAAITRREVEITNVRKGRRPPGLSPDLIATARAVATVSSGRLEGDTPGSDTLTFMPGIPAAGSYTFDASAAADAPASATLLLQALAPVLALAPGPSEVVVRGTTHAAGCPTATYLQTVFVPTARKFGLRAEIATPRWGWAPDGVGEIRAKVEPVGSFRPAEITTRGELLQIGGSAVATSLGDGFAERLRNRVERRMQEVGRTARVEICAAPAEGKGGLLFLLAVFERAIAGFTGVASEASSAEQAADEAVNELFSYLTSYSALDKYVADQILLYAALAAGETSFSTAELTAHTMTTAELARRFLPVRTRFSGAVGQPCEIRVTGEGVGR
jgi:RNA 3'-terminal phosphate cyclase (ATP)